MKSRLLILALSTALVMGAFSSRIREVTSAISQKDQSVKTLTATNGINNTGWRVNAAHYRINPSQSRFMVEAFSGGLLWFLGHNHHFAIRDFTGEAQITPGTFTPASLQMTVKADSIEETGKEFTEQQKQIINNEARKQVLNVEEYPEIVFKSANISGKVDANGQFKAKINGDLTLHGVTRPIEIPLQVTLDERTLHANGEFSINRSDYKVKTHSIKAGLVRVKNRVKITFNILADKV
jgi:polyisoprenoid-binding protein YceI